MITRLQEFKDYMLCLKILEENNFCFFSWIDNIIIYMMPFFYILEVFFILGVGLFEI